MRTRWHLTALCLAVLGCVEGGAWANVGKVSHSQINPKCKEMPTAPDPNITPPVRIKGSWPGEPHDGSQDSQVQLMIRVNTEGRVEDVVLCYSSNSTYAFKVMDAVRKWLYRPATLDGRPVDYRLWVVTTRETRRQ